MTLYQWLCVVGVPSIGSALLAFLVSQIKANRAMRLGIQAMLRDRLLQAYRHYSSKGYADLDDRANFENLYIQYHNLGANGVMSDIRDKFLKLPVFPNE